MNDDLFLSLELIMHYEFQNFKNVPYYFLMYSHIFFSIFHEYLLSLLLKKEKKNEVV